MREVTMLTDEEGRQQRSSNNNHHGRIVETMGPTIVGFVILPAIVLTIVFFVC